jgi:murein DD-endopeptidase MepM/ murein hydrolase activator NlpD
VVSLVGLGGGLEGYAIRYMHLGAIRPDLKPGMVVEAGDELGVLGGTAVQDSLPHVHLDVTSPSGVALDMKSILTGDSPQPGCGRRTGAKHPLHHKPAAR